MKKRYRNMQKKANGNIREIGDGSVLLELPLSVAGVIESLPEVIRELAREARLLLMSASMDSECERIAAAKDSKNPFIDSGKDGIARAVEKGDQAKEASSRCIRCGDEPHIQSCTR